MRDGGCSRPRKDLVLVLTKVGGEPSTDGNLRQGLGQCSESKPGGPGPKDDGPSVQRTEKGEVIPDQGGEALIAKTWRSFHSKEDNSHGLGGGAKARKGPSRRETNPKEPTQGQGENRPNLEVRLRFSKTWKGKKL